MTGARRAMRVEETPLRAVNAPTVDGCKVLSTPGLTYSDGSEPRLFDILSAAGDLSSLSDELELAAKSWSERYHLTKSRANVLRALNLKRDHIVLEVGAGCGAITRYLGETCGLVDALEPMLHRARVARERTKDLPNVEVHVGEIGDVPAEPAYDVVFLIGVLEYVDGSGRESKETFLARIRRLLRPGGHVVCAIENRIGVKYLAGAPEDHTGRVFDSVENYPLGAQVETFSRGEITALFERVGFETTVLGAFPDYKVTRVVMADRLFERAPDLAWRLPLFPSPDWLAQRPQLADEFLTWKTFVSAGLGPHLVNSFLVLASDGQQTLWHPDLLGCFYSTERRARFMTETQVGSSADTVRFERSRLAGGEPSATSGDLSLHVTSGDFVAGRDFVDVASVADENTLRDLIAAWVETVMHSRPDDIDLVPHNLVVRPDGTVVPIDTEWHHAGYSHVDTIERGVLLLAQRLVDRRPPGRWPGRHVRDGVAFLGMLAGLDGSGGWVNDAIDREARLQVAVKLLDQADPRSACATADSVQHFHAFLDRSLLDTSLGRRAYDELDDVRHSLSEVLSKLARYERIEFLLAPPRSLRRRVFRFARRARDFGAGRHAATGGSDR